MKKPHCLLWAAAVIAMYPAMAVAAPLDAFLTANRPVVAGKGEFEAAYDVVNDTVDVFNVRDNSSDFHDTNIGDYHGAHLRAGVAVTPRLWVDGGYWQRRIDYRNDNAKLHSWQLGTQYRLLEVDMSRPAVALRASAWGNYADDLKKTSPTSFQGITADTVKVDSPKDVQVQLDLIGTWPVRKDTELTAFVGVGKSKVSVDSVTATTNRDGCRYNLAFGSNEVVGTLAQPCGSSSLDRFTVPNSVAGVSVNKETEYDATYFQAGFSAKWWYENWGIRIGYQYQNLSRDDVDDIINSRGGKTYDKNHIVVGELTYRFNRNVKFLLRGQYMEYQFTGEIPFAYNSFTSHRFGERYGFASAGLIVDF